MIKTAKISTYHPGGVLKNKFSIKKNCRFGISIVDYPLRRRDLGRVPLTISKKFPPKFNGKKRNRTKKIKCLGQDLNLCHVTYALSHSATHELSSSFLSRTSFLFFILTDQFDF